MIKLNYKSDLNSEENLKIAKKLIIFFEIKKYIPFKTEIAYFIINDHIGHRQYIKLTENNYIKIYDKTCFEVKDLVNINIDYLIN